MELRVGKLVDGSQSSTAESISIKDGDHTIVVGTVAYRKGVNPRNIPAEVKVAQAHAALAAAVELAANADQK